MTGIQRFAFATAGQIIFGRGTVQDAPRYAAALGTKALVVTGSSGARAAWLVDALFVSGMKCGLK